MLSLDHFGLTDAGKVRQNNEDALLSGEGRDPALFAVADGIGGFDAGEVASSMVVESLKRLEPGGPLESAIQEANRRVYSAARDDEKLSGMGTTVVAVRITDSGDGLEAEVSHVGDSRAYLLRDGEMAPLTEDHSLVAELVRSGSLTRAQASEHPQKNLITRALGAEEAVQVDSARYRLQSGDRLVLCSDGLPDMVTEARISEMVSGDSAGSAEESARRLVSAALSAGGTDNVTVVVVDVGGRRDRPAGAGAAAEGAATRVRDRGGESGRSSGDRGPAGGTRDRAAEPVPERGSTRDGSGDRSPRGRGSRRRLRRDGTREETGTRRGSAGRSEPRNEEQERAAYAGLREGESLIPGVWDSVIEEPEPRKPTPEEIVEQFRFRPAPEEHEVREEPRRRRRRKRVERSQKAVSALVRGLAALALVGLLLVPPYLWWSTRYFMAYNDGEVVIYQGIPYDFLGNELNRLDQRTGVQESDIAEPYRDQIRDNRIYTEDRLQTVLEDLQKE